MTPGELWSCANRRWWGACLRGMAAAAVLLATLPLGACERILPLMGQAGVPGYLTREPPPEYRDLRNPYTPEDGEAVAAGRTIYAVQCLRCHGARGLGDGPQAPHLEPAPANFTAPLIVEGFRDYQDYVFWIVSEGKERSGMPPFHHILTETERWQAITYAWYLGEQTENAVR